jgi:hypothetical protein
MDVTTNKFIGHVYASISHVNSKLKHYAKKYYGGEIPEMLQVFMYEKVNIPVSARMVANHKFKGRDLVDYVKSQKL